MPGKSTYDRRTFMGDTWGGLAAMLVALPSAIAFGVSIFSPLGGSLAAQGALAGVLGASVLGLIAPLCGSSPRLITAPCAPAAAMLAASAITFTQQGLPAATVLLLVGLIGVLGGLFQIGLGLSRVGQLNKFTPYPVVSGYLTGVGLIIIGGQIPKLLGVPAGIGWMEALTMPSAWSPQGMAVGGVVMAVMIATPHITRAVPASIAALAAGMIAYFALARFDPALLAVEHNPLLVGPIGTGGDRVTDVIGSHWRTLTESSWSLALKAVIPAATLAVLLSVDTLKTCVVLDVTGNSDHDPDRVLVGQGVANLASALVGGIPGAGTMGASLINASSGGRTRGSGLIAGALCFAAFLVLSPVIAWVPVPALAAILIVLGYRMIDRHSVFFFFTPATRLDFLVIVSVVLVALLADLIAASVVGVAFAIMLFIRENTRGSVIRSRIEGHQIHSKRKLSPADIEKLGLEDGDTVVFELQGSLFFGTARQLYTALQPETLTRKYVILSMRRVQSLDLSATQVLEQIKDRLEENGASLVFCDIPKGLPSGLKMKRFLKEVGVVRPSNKAFAFRQLEEALEWVEERKLRDGPSRDAEAAGLELDHMPIFADQPAEAMADLEAAMTIRPFKADKKVFKAGTDGNELFLIRRGSVKIMLPVHKKEHYHLATCGPGEIVGGIGFLDCGAHAADAVALSDAELYVLAHEQFMILAQRHPGLAIRLVESVARNLAERLRATVTEINALRG